MSRSCRILFDRLQDIVRDNFQDPDFCVEKAAQLLRISKRHLHGICAAAGKPFSCLLMDTRLQYAREKLNDRRYGEHRVGDIAFMCGFADPSHFARRFRGAYGCSPTAYRLIYH
jgi:AraC-like DNA-binding protein